VNTTPEQEQYIEAVLMKTAQMASEHLARSGTRGSMMILFNSAGNTLWVANVTEEDQVEWLTKVVEILKSSESTSDQPHKEH